MEKYPLELRVNPIPVVALVGKSRVADKIKEILLTSFQLKGLVYDLTDPIAFSSPPKRLTYDNYIAKGILKANWMHKMVNVNASAVAILIPWCDKEGRDEDGKPWHTREPDLLQVVSYIQRNYQHLRNPNHIIFLTILAPGLTLAETSCAEKLALFRRKIDYSSDRYFSYISEDNLSPTSLASPAEGLKELASNYYLEEGRRFKKEKDLITRRQQPLVYVRLHWKVAFLSEFRNDTHGTLKYYTAAYGYCHGVPKEHALEAKYIADYSNFKLCKIFLQKFGMAEAIGQFQRHMRAYKQPSPYFPPALESEHWGWVSHQYQVLGELLHELAPSNTWVGSNPSYNHPAYYFHCAGTYAVKRRKKSAIAIKVVKPELLEKYKDLPSLHLASVDLSKQQYVGQLPHERSEYDDSNSLGYDEWVLARRAIREHNVPHSRKILELLQRAHTLYSIRVTSGVSGSTCRRTKLFLIYEIAEESFEAGMFDKAKVNYDALRTSVISEEGWSTLSMSIAQRALECALELKETRDVIRLSLYLCEPNTPLPLVDKEALQSQLVHTMAHLEDFGLAPLAEPLEIYVSNPQHPLLDVDCQFTERNVRTGSKVIARVRIHSHFPHPIRFSSLRVTFSDSVYDVTISDSDEEELLLLPEEPRIFEFPAVAKSPCDLSFEKIFLNLGQEGASVSFQWDVATWEVDTEVALLKLDRDFVQRTSTCILDPEPQVALDMEHLPPALVGEHYRLVLRLNNQGDEDMTEGTLLVSDPSGSSGSAGPPCRFYSEDLQPLNGAGLPVQPVAAGKQGTVVVYVLAQQVAKLQPIAVELCYQTSSYSTRVSRSFGIPVILALSSCCAFFSDLFVPCIEATGSSTTIRTEQTWIIRVEVRNNCPYPISVVEATLKLNENANCLASADGAIFGNTADHTRVLYAMDKLTTWFKLKPTAPGRDVNIGQFELRWKRKSHEKALPGSEADYERVVYSPTLIPPVDIERAPFIMRLGVPPSATVGTAIECTLQVTNITRRVEEFTLSLTDSPNFLLAGTRTAIFKVTPQSTFTFTSNLVPLKAGKVSLPHFQVSSKRFSHQMGGVQPRQYIFVNPRIL